MKSFLNRIAAVLFGMLATMSAARAQLAAVQSVPNAFVTVGAGTTSVTPVTASGGTGPYAFAIVPALPEGLALNASTGAITGTAGPAFLEPVFAGYDDFNAGTKSKWAYYFRLAGDATGNGAIDFVNSRLEFTKGADAGSFFIGWDSDPASADDRVVASFAQSWVADLTVTNAFNAESGRYAAIGFEVAAGAGKYSSVVLTNAGGTRLIRAAGAGTTEAVVAATANTVHLRLEWDAGAARLRAAYSYNRIDYIALKEFNIGAEWGALPSSGFYFEVLADSDSAAPIPAARMIADGFKLSAAARTTHTVTVTDSTAATATNTFGLTVLAPPFTATTALAAASANPGAAVTPFTPVTAAGGVPALTFGVSPPLASGLSINPASGQISGTPSLAALTAPFAGRDDFESGSDAKWAYFLRTNSATAGELTFSNGRLDFSKPAGPGNYMLGWDGLPGVFGSRSTTSFETSWVADLDVTNTFATSGQYVAIGFEVADAGQYSSVMLSAGGGLRVRAEGSGTTPVEVAVTNNTDVRLRLSWNAATKELAALYSTDGSTFTPVKTFTPATQWTTNPAGGFQLEVFASSDAVDAVPSGIAHADNFSIRAVSLPHTVHTVTATDRVGRTASSIFRLAMNSPITAQPVAQSVISGAPATFSVGTAGTSGFTYLWRKNGTVIPGATAASYTIPAARRADEGAYDVLISDAGGITRSEIVALTVAPTAYPGHLRADTSWTPDPLTISTRVYAALPLPNGQWLVGGDFVRWETHPRAGLARLNADLTLDTAWMPPVINGTVHALARATDGTIYFGGDFTSVDALPRAGLARLTGANLAHDASWRSQDPLPAVATVVTALAVQDNNQPLVARTSSIPGIVSGTNVLRRLHLDGTHDTSFSTNIVIGGTQRLLSVVAEPGTNAPVVFAGAFVSVNGTTRNGIARVNNTGTTLDPVFAGSGTNGPVQTITRLADGRYLIGGQFTTVNATSRGSLALLDATTGALNADFAPPFVGGNGIGIFGAALLTDGRILVAGNFTQYGGANAAGLARLNGATGALDSVLAVSTGSQHPFFAPTTAGRSLAVFPLPGGAAAITGVFSEILGARRIGVAVVNADGSLAATPNSLAHRPAYASAAFLETSGALTAMGSIEIAGGAASANGIARVTSGGAIDSAFPGGSGFTPNGLSTFGVYRAVRQGDGRYLALGDFVGYNGAPANRIVRINPSGAIDASFNNAGSGPSSPFLQPLALSGRRTLLYGNFGSGFGALTYDGVTVGGNIMRLNADGSRDASFAPGAGFDLAPLAVLEYPDTEWPGGFPLIVGGGFSSYNGVSVPRLVRLNPDGTRDASFPVGSGPTGGAVHGFALLPDGRIVVHGSFTAYDGAAANRIVIIGGGGIRETTFAASTAVDAPVNQVIVQPNGKLLVFGEFTSGPALRLHADGTHDATFALQGVTGFPGGSLGARYILADDGSLYLYNTLVSIDHAPPRALVRFSTPPAPVIAAVTPAGAAPGASVTISGSHLAGVTSVSFNGASSVFTYDPAAGTISATIPALARSGPVTVTTSSGTSAGFAYTIPLTILTQPVHNVVSPGQAASLSVGLAGGAQAGAYSYQWRRDGTAIPGATGSVHYVGSMAAADAGDYDVVVGDGTTTLHSRVVALRLARPMWEWSNRRPVGNDLAAVAYGAGRYVAVGYAGTIATSTNGTTWVAQPQRPPNVYLDIGFSGTEFVAVGSNGNVLRSTDGLDWTQHNVGAAGFLYGLAYAHGKWVVVGAGGAILTSANGMTWTPQPVAGFNVNLHAVAATATGFVAVSAEGHVLSGSSDAATWTVAQPSATAGVALFDVEFANGVYVAAGRGQIFTSSNAATWTSAALPTTAAGIDWNAIVSTTDGFTVAGGSYVTTSSTPQGYVVQSSNGSSWTLKTLPLGAAFEGIAHGAAGYVAVGLLGRLDHSPDGNAWSTSSTGFTFAGDLFAGATGPAGTLFAGNGGNIFLSANHVDGWTKIDAGTTLQLFGATYGNGHYVIVGGNNNLSAPASVIVSSPTGAAGTWAKVDLASSLALNAVAYGAHAGKFVAGGVGANLYHATTPSGAWTSVAKPTPHPLRAVVVGGGRYVFVGDNGAIVTSTDGVAWTTATSATNAPLSVVAYGNGVFVAGGFDAVAIRSVFVRSTDGLNWTVVDTPFTGSIRGLTFADGRFTTVGGTSTVLTSADGLVWSADTSQFSGLFRAIVRTPAGYLAAGTAGAIARLAAPSATTVAAQATLVAGTVATPFTPVSAGAGHPPYTFSISPALPAGLTFDSATGAIAGTPSYASATAAFVGSDDFNAGSSPKWPFYFRLNPASTNGDLAFVNSRLEFTKSAGAGSHFLIWDGDPSSTASRTTASYATSWVADLAVSNTFAAAGGEFATVGFQAAGLFNNYMALMLAPGGEVIAEINGAAAAVVPTGVTTGVRLRLTWNAASETLNASYSVDGTNYVSVADLTPATAWPLPGARGGFNLGVFGNSNAAAAIAGGVVFVDDFRFQATSPAATFHAVTVTDQAGVTGTSGFRITIDAPVSNIAAISPASAIAGSTVTIDGAGFTGATAVTFNGLAAASFTVVSDTQITAVVPAGAASGPVVVTTAVGATIASPASFTLLVPPAIVDAPIARVAVAGGRVQFRVAASGSAPLAYQWLKDGAVIAGATAPELLLANLSSADAGAYSVRVGNAASQVTSTPAALVVLPAAPVVWQQFTEFSTEQSPARTVHDGNGKVYLPWSVQDRGPDMAAGQFVGALARFNESDGSLDPTFKLDPRFRAATHVVVLPGGSLLVSVRSGDANTVIRTNDTGAVDPAFQAPQFARGIRFITAQADGKVLVVATDNVDVNAPAGALGAGAPPTVFRLKADLSLDDTFTPAVLNVGGNIFGPPVVDGSGRIYLAGAFGSVNGVTRINLARLSADGSVDVAYADPASLPAGFASAQARGIALQSDGRAVAVGDFIYSGRGTDANRIQAIRLTEAGALDTTFAMPLRTELGLAAGLRLRFLVRTAGDAIVAVSDRLVKLGANGAPDAAFQSRAFAREAFWVSQDAAGRFFVPDQNGVAGSQVMQPLVGNGIACLAPDGSPDPSFQTGGWGRIAYPTNGVVLGDGRVWVAGNFNRYAGLNVPGLVQFGTDGLPTAANGPALAQGRTMAFATLASAGNDNVYAVLAQPANSLQTIAPSLVRITPEGSLDGSFAPTPPPGYALTSAALHAAPSGRLLLAQGSISAQAALDGATGDALVRLNANGTRDATFNPVLSSFAVVERGANNAVTMIRTGGLNVAQVLGDGSTLLVVSAVDGNLRLLRLTPSGAVDATFNPPSFGTITPSVGFTSAGTVDPVTNTTAQFNISTYNAADLVRAAVQMPDGKVYVGGRFSLAGAPRGLVRLNSDGTLDASFTGAGIAFGGADAGPYIDALAVDSAGRLYAAGRFDRFNDTALPGLFRLRTDGSLDTQWSPGFGIADAPRAAARLVPVGEKLYVFGTVHASGDPLPSIYQIAHISAPPSISVQPTATTALVGQAASLSITVSGSGPFTYQWFRGTVALAGQTAAALTFASPQVSDEGSYAVVVTGSGGSVTSAPALLTVHAPVVVTTPPVSQALVAGGTATFTVVADGRPAPAYQWKKDGVALANATSATLTIDGVSTSHVGSYTVDVSNAVNTVTAGPATLALNAPVAITTQPTANAAYNVGAAITLRVVATGAPQPAYQWFKGSAEIPGATTDTLAFSSVQLADAGTYRVTVSNSLNSVTSSAVNFEVFQPPLITTQPQSQTIVAGQSVTFSVGVDASPAPAFQWRRNGFNLSGATGSTLTLASVPANGGASFSVVVTNLAGTATSSAATLMVNPAAPVITSPATATAILGRAFAYQVATTATQATFVATGLPAGLTLDSGTGSIAGVPTTAGTFVVTLTATNVSGSDTRLWTLTVLPPPPIINSPASATARVGAAFSFTVQAANMTEAGSTYDATGLPGGLVLNATTGVISGVPAVAGTFTVTLGATNASGRATSSLVLTVEPQLNAPAFSGSTSVSGVQGATFTFTPAFANGVTSYAASGLPAGLMLNATTGAITGTPTATGTFNVQISATNATGTTTIAFTFTINPAPSAPVITSASTVSAVVGQPFSFALSASGAATSFSAVGLPASLILDPATGVISGTPAAPGTFAVQVRAASAVGTGPQAVLVIAIQPAADAPIVTSSPIAQGRANQPFNYNLAATNTPASFVITSGTLPAGLALNATTGAITGTPTAAGERRVWVAAVNASGQGLALEIVFTIAPALTMPVVTSNGTAAAQVGQPFTYVITATNSPTSFAATGLPPGLVLDAVTGVISGVPAQPTTTPVSIALTATNADGTSSVKILLLTIAPAPATPVITSALSANAGVGNAFTYQATATENATSFAATGLPAGLALNAATGAITGTPTQSGSFGVTLRAANAFGLGAPATLSLVIAPAAAAPAITSAASASGKVGAASAFSYQVTATNGPIVAYALTGTLPLGLAFNTSTGLLSGLPAEAGVFTVELTATNAAGTSLPQTLVINIAPADNVPVITSALYAVATVGDAFAYQITAANMPATPAPFPAPNLLDAVNLPAGLAVNPSTGLIQGVPSVAGVFTATLVGTNAAGTGPLRDLILLVQPAATAPVVTSLPSAAAQVGRPFAYQILATNSPTSYEVLDAPAWMSLNGGTGAVAGTPATPGTFTVRLVATNAAGASNPVTLTLTIAPAANTPVVTSSRTATAQVNAPFAYAIAASNSPTAFIATGLPAGLTLDAATGAISGTPKVSGQFEITLLATNANGTGQPVTLILTVQPSLTLVIPGS